MARSVPREAQQLVCVCANELGDVKDCGEYRQAAGPGAEVSLFSPLFERAWPFSSWTRRVTAQIPTIPWSTRRARTPVLTLAASAVVVTKDGRPDGF